MVALTTIKKITIIVAMTLFCLSCTREQTSFNQSSPESQVTFETSDKKKDEKVISMNSQEMKFIEGSRKLLSQKYKNKSDLVKDSIEQVIQPGLKLFITSSYLFNPKNKQLKTPYGYYLLSTLLSVFNEAVLKSYQVDKESVNKTGVFKRYKSLLNYDCSTSRLGSCLFLNQFKAKNSVDLTAIIKILYSQSKNEKEKFRLLILADSMRNFIVDHELNLLWLEQLQKTSFKEDKDDYELRKHFEHFAGILKDEKSNIENFSEEFKERYKAITSEMKILEMSRKSDKIEKLAMTELLFLQAKFSLYDKNGVTSSFQKIANQRAYSYHRSESEFGLSFMKDNMEGNWLNKGLELNESLLDDCKKLCESKKSVVEKLKKEKKDLKKIIYPSEMNKVKDYFLSDVQFEIYDEYSFLAHQMFYGHYSSSDAASFWSATKKDEKRLVKAAQDLIKVATINAVIVTNLRMKSFYGGGVSDLFEELVNEALHASIGVRENWRIVKERSRRLSDFVENVIDDKDAESFISLRKSTRVFAKSIKYLSTYPQMLILLHIVSSFDSVTKVPTAYGIISIEPTTVINQFFSGQLGPWLNFGHDRQLLDSFEIILSFFYSIKSRMFETLDGLKINTDIKLSFADVFKKVIFKIVKDPIDEMKSRIRAMESNIKSFTISDQVLEKRCSVERKWSQQEKKYIQSQLESLGDDVDFQSWRKVYLESNKKEKITNEQNKEDLQSDRSYISDKNFFNLSTPFYTPTIKKKGGLEFYLRSLYSKENIQTVRNIGSEHLFSIAVYNILNFIIEKFGSDEMKRIVNGSAEDGTAGLGVKKEYELVKSQFLEMLLNRIKVINGCERDFIERDKKIRTVLILKETQFLEKLFDQMMTRDNEKVKSLMGQYTNNNNYPQNYREMRGYMEMSDRRVILYKMDTLARINKYLNDEFPKEFNIDYDSPIFFQNREDFKRQGGAELVLPSLAPDDKGGERAKEQFVKFGLQKFKEYNSWVNFGLVTEVLNNKRELFVELYKVNGLCSEEHKDLPGCETLSATEVIHYYQSVLEWYAISKEDKFVLDLVGDDAKYNAKLYLNLVVKSDEEDELQNPMDQLFKTIFLNNRDKVWFLETFNQVTTSVSGSQSGNFIFPFPPELYNNIMEFYKPFVKNYFDSSYSFLKELSQIENTYSTYEYDMSIGALEFQKNSYFDGLLSAKMIRRFNNSVKKIRKSSRGKYPQLEKDSMKKLFEFDPIRLEYDSDELLEEEAGE